MKCGDLFSSCYPRNSRGKAGNEERERETFNFCIKQDKERKKSSVVFEPDTKHLGVSVLNFAL